MQQANGSPLAASEVAGTLMWRHGAGGCMTTHVRPLTFNWRINRRGFVVPSVADARWNGVRVRHSNRVPSRDRTLLPVLKFVAATLQSRLGQAAVASARRGK